MTEPRSLCTVSVPTLKQNNPYWLSRSRSCLLGGTPQRYLLLLVFTEEKKKMFKTVSEVVQANCSKVHSSAKKVLQNTGAAIVATRSDFFLNGDDVEFDCHSCQMCYCHLRQTFFAAEVKTSKIHKNSMFSSKIYKNTQFY